jgi:hypothetical protein
VRTAVNGLEGLLTAYEMRPDVIVMDLTMPVVNGSRPRFAAAQPSRLRTTRRVGTHPLGTAVAAGEPRIVEWLKTFAARKNATAAQIALAWLLAREAVDCADKRHGLDGHRRLTIACGQVPRTQPRALMRWCDPARAQPWRLALEPTGPTYYRRPRRMRPDSLH